MNLLLVLLSSLLISPNYKAPAIQKAPMAKDTIQVQAYRYGYVPYPPDSTKYKSYSDWYGSLVAEDGQIWVFDIICDSTEERGIFPTEGKEYTLKNDMIQYYTFWMEYEAGPWKPATDAKFKYWIGEDELEHIDAYMKCDNGKQYHITYRTKTVPESFVDRYDTLRVVTLGDYRDSAEHCFQFTAKNDSMTAVFAIDNMVIPGHYTKENLFGELDQFTYLNINSIERYLCDFSVDIEAGEKKGEYLIDAKFYGYNGKCYNIKMDCLHPDPVNEIDITCDNMKVEMITFYDVMIQGYSLTASTDKYQIEYMLGAPGGIQTNGIHMIDKETGKTIDIYGDRITVYNPLHAEGVALDYDGNYYTLSMRGPRPDSTEVREIEIYDAYLTDFTKSDGVFLLEGVTSDSLYYFGMAIYNNKVEGTYNQDDADFNYTYVGDLYVAPDGETTVVGGYHLIALDAEVKKVGDYYEVEATFLGQTLAETVITPAFKIQMTTAPKATNLPYTSTPLLPYTKKELRDGRIIIERKGTKYNILGSQLTN